MIRNLFTTTASQLFARHGGDVSEYSSAPLALDESVRRLVEGRRIIMASNRGPVEFVRNSDNGNALEARRGSGGVVTALSAMANWAPLTWIASPMSEGDRAMAEQMDYGRIPSPFHGEQLDLRFVPVTQEAYDRYYNVFANPLLWFLQHYFWDLARTPMINAAVYDAWENGYTLVNRAFADAIIQEAHDLNSEVVVLFQDYHLYLAPGYVREQLPTAVLQHFVHIPWPSPRYWLVLPAHMRHDILKNICANDIVGLQTARDVVNFLYSCEVYLDGAEADYVKDQVTWQGHVTRAREYPVSIDVAEVQTIADSPEAQECLDRLLPIKGEHTIIRIDRLEPTKNILRGLMAFDGLLSRYPEFAGKVKHWVFLVPSRTDLRSYQQYADEVFDLIDKINEQHGNDAWRPIEVFYENNYVQAIAAMTCYDVMLVNSVIDGMNLVAKEGSVVNRCDGVLVLSEGTGAFEQLGPYALPVSPTDVEGTIRALHAALTMPPEERKERAAGLREVASAYNLTHWVQAQVQDLLAVR